MLAPLLALQLSVAVEPPRSTYSSPALAAFIGAAARENRQPPATLRGYHASVESELSLVARDTLGRERAAQIEQVAMTADWERNERYDLHVIGYRSQTVGVPYSALSFARSWTIPSLYGDRLTLGVDFTRARSKDSVHAPSSDTVRAVHPLATDRERFYRFSGGDTIAVLRSRNRMVAIARVHVTPVFDSAARRSRIAAFDGEIDFDAQRHQIVRMRGQFVSTEPRRGRFTIARMPGLVGVAYVELVNAEVDGQYWLPAYQRTEFQAAFAPLGSGRSIFRLVSRFSNLDVAIAPDSSAGPSVELTGNAAGSTPPVRQGLSFASQDSISSYHAWLQPLGVATANVHASDFDDLAPDVWRVNGPARFDVAPTKLDEVFRYNRVEGLYTGIAGEERFRDASPGLTAHGYAGWAWSENSVRGGVSTSLRRGSWLTTLRAERLLASTNDFTLPLEGGSDAIGALFAGVDDQDYVDRRLAALDLTRELGGSRGARITLEGGAGGDRSELARVDESPLRIGHFRENRASANGKYVRGAATLEIHPDVTGLFLEPGVGAVLDYEIGRGDLTWQRAEATISARQQISDLVIAARVQGGLVAGAVIPPQELFELGGENALPGYAYKEFGGDRAAAAGVLAAYTFPVLRKPIRVVRSFFVPGLSPGVAAGVQGGWAEASTTAARRALQALDPAAASCASANNCAALLSVPTNGVRATVDVRLTLLGGLIGIGVARPIDHAARWRLAFRFAQEY